MVSYHTKPARNTGCGQRNRDAVLTRHGQLRLNTRKPIPIYCNKYRRPLPSTSQYITLPCQFPSRIPHGCLREILLHTDKCSRPGLFCNVLHIPNRFLIHHPSLSVAPVHRVAPHSRVTARLPSDCPRPYIIQASLMLYARTSICCMVSTQTLCRRA